MNFNLDLKGNRIAVQVQKQENKTEAGIIIPDSAKDLPNRANVIAKGPGVFSPQLGKHVEIDVQVGDTVLFTKYAGSEIEIEKEKYLIIKEPDVIATFKKDNK